jgi:hypothetical protein
MDMVSTVPTVLSNEIDEPAPAQHFFLHVADFF